MRDTPPLDIAGGLLLTAAAGYVDAVGFLRLDGLYTSFMSGNSTQFAASLSQAGHPIAWEIGLLFVCFLTGGFCGSLVSLRVPGRWGPAAVLGVEAALIVVALTLAFSPAQGPVAPLLAAAMGAQNAALRRSAGFRPGVTFVTGTLFSLSHTLAQAATRIGPGTSSGPMPQRPSASTRWPRPPGAADRFQLARAFRLRFGTSPHACLVEIRLARARAHLRAGMPPAEAALAAGFSDQSHLGRWLRRAYGLTPAVYRSGRTNVPDRAIALG